MREIGNRVQDLQLQRALDAAVDATDRRLRTDRTGATYHDVQIPAGGDASIVHRRGHPVRWSVVRTRLSPAQVYETSNDEHTLRLHHGGALATRVEVMVW